MTCDNRPRKGDRIKVEPIRYLADIKRIKNHEVGTRNTALYLNHLAEFRNLALFSNRIAKVFDDLILNSVEESEPVLE